MRKGSFRLCAHRVMPQSSRGGIDVVPEPVRRLLFQQEIDKDRVLAFKGTSAAYASTRSRRFLICSTSLAIRETASSCAE